MKNQNGVTLIELLIVIAIIGVLASIVLVSLGNARSRANMSSIKSTVAEVVYQGVICHAGGGTVLGGNGGSPICSDTNVTDVAWPLPQPCGSVPSDAMFTVDNGSVQGWDFYLSSCVSSDLCTGVSKAICTETGCTYGGTCT